MKKSPLTKALVIIVLVFFLLSTGLMFVLYLASPATIISGGEDIANTQRNEQIIESELSGDIQTEPSMTDTQD